MNSISEILKPIDGYLSSIVRDTVNGYYYLEIGIPDDWVYDGNIKIECELIEELKDDEGTVLGVILKIYPKDKTIIIDDLVRFVQIIVNTNQKIAEKKEVFKENLNKIKAKLEKEVGEHYKELDDYQEEAFKIVGANFVSDLESKEKPKPTTNENTEPVKKKRGRPPKNLPVKTQTKEAVK